LLEIVIKLLDILNVYAFNFNLYRVYDIPKIYTYTYIYRVMIYRVMISRSITYVFNFHALPF